MTLPPVPLVIATLPSTSVEEARREAEAAAMGGADLAEVRFDRWGPTEQARAADLFPSPLPLLATLRSTAEGGTGPIDPGARADWHASVRALPFAWIDVEHARDPVPAVDGGREVTYVVSSHFAPGTAWAKVLAPLRDPMPPHAVPKIVVPASVGDTLRALLPGLPPAATGRRIVMTTGPSGPLLRAWARRLGSAAVYGALPKGSTPSPAVEPTQIPVDRLRRYLSADPAPPLFAVIGRPVGHSRSPDLHHHWMARHGREGLYIALEFASEEELADALPDLVAGGLRGLNVTHPFKEAALRLATRSGPGAEACGCANTLSFRDGETEAENTDLLAMLRRLEELRSAHEWDGSELLVVGTGGAARATLAAARELGSRAILVGRNASAASDLASRFGATVGDPATPREVPLVVHATTVGRQGAGSLGVPLGPWLGPGSLLLDFVYRAEERSLEEIARARRARYEDGSRLLAFAAAASYEIWWGERPTLSEIDSALEAP